MKKDADKYPHELFVQNAMINWLRMNNWGKNMIVTDGGGPDIHTTNNRFSRTWTIECKGGTYTAKYPDACDAVNFRLALGQVLMRKGGTSRTKPSAGDGGNKLGVAFPNTPGFVRHLHGFNWQFAKALNLYFFFVDKGGNVEMYDWKRLKREFSNEATKKIV
jgi:hypothetical protein